MSDSAGISFGKNVFLFMSVVGVALWIGLLINSEGENKLNEACLPIAFVTDGVHDLTTGLVGYPPNWTLRMKSYLMGGCYYFFSVILTEDNTTDDYSGRPQGGVRIK